jgi:hypothetical protein
MCCNAQAGAIPDGANNECQHLAAKNMQGAPWIMPGCDQNAAQR